MKKIQAKEKNCTWFYCDGWRYGKIIKRYSENRVTVKNCSGKKYRIQRNIYNKWIALSNEEFKGENKIKKDNKNTKKKIVIKIKRKTK